MDGTTGAGAGAALLLELVIGIGFHTIRYHMWVQRFNSVAGTLDNSYKLVSNTAEGSAAMKSDKIYHYYIVIS